MTTHDHQEYDNLIDALRDDLRELATCSLLCTFHIALGIVIMRYVMSGIVGHTISWDASCSTGVLLGGVKLLQVSDGRSYMHRVHDHWMATHKTRAVHPIALLVLVAVLVWSIGGRYV